MLAVIINYNFSFLSHVLDFQIAKQLLSVFLMHVCGWNYLKYIPILTQKEDDQINIFSLAIWLI